MDGRRDGDFPVRDERSTEGVVFGRSRVLIARAVTFPLSYPKLMCFVKRIVVRCVCHLEPGRRTEGL